MIEQQIIAKKLGIEDIENIKPKKEKALHFSSNILVEQSYFDLAKEWYIAKYLSPFAMLFYMLLVFSILSFASYQVYKIATIYYAVQKIPFATYFDDTAEYFAKIRPIVEQKHEKIAISLSRYMLHDYISLRENYSRDLLQMTKWNDLLEKVRNLSSRKVYTEYIHYMNIYENPESPILKYRFFEIRTAQITKIKFIDEDQEEIPSSAIVFFDAITLAKDKVLNLEKKKALVDFSINDIQIGKRNKSEPLSFVVTSYLIEDDK